MNINHCVFVFCVSVCLGFGGLKHTIPTHTGGGPPKQQCCQKQSEGERERQSEREEGHARDQSQDIGDFRARGLYVARGGERGARREWRRASRGIECRRRSKCGSFSLWCTAYHGNILHAFGVSTAFARQIAARRDGTSRCDALRNNTTTGLAG